MFAATTRAYTGNEILAAGIDLIATSAAEPHIEGWRYRRERRQVRNEKRYLKAIGIPNRAGRRQVDALMVRNGFWEEVDQHPLVKLLNNPNKYTPRDQFWASLVVDYYLAGDAYILKARYQDGPLEGAVGELWRLRPDRMKPVPGNMAAGEPFIKEYVYTVDRTETRIAADDIIHIKARNPLNPYEGMAPVASLLPRVAIDTYQRNFLSTFYERGGAGVGAMLNIKGKMSQEMRDDLRNRFKRMFRAGQYDILVMSADDASYTPFGLDRGLRDALPREINDVTESRIATVLGIPASILGLLVGQESSSYANKRQDWQVFWDITMSPLLSNFGSTINMSLTPEFGNIDEVQFDMSDIRALQEDEDALEERHRKNWIAGIAGFRETRTKLGFDPEPEGSELFAIPTSSEMVLASELGKKPEPVVPAMPPEPPPAPANVSKRGRPRLEDDVSAKAIWAEAERIKARSPSITWEQVAARVGVTDRTLREYRRRFSESEDDSD